MADHAAVEMQYEDFVDHYDDLWRPAADDVWIVWVEGGASLQSATRNSFFEQTCLNLRPDLAL